jgi:hypothetical protein
MIQLRVDARPLFFPKPNDPAANGLRPQSLSLGFGFTTPFKLFRWLQVANDDDVRDENGEGQGQIEAQDAHDEDVELEITAAIGGGFKTMTQEATFVDPETQEEETRSVSNSYRSFQALSDIRRFRYLRCFWLVVSH